MGIFDWRPWGESGSPKPKGKAADVDAIGYGGEINPLTTAERGSTVDVIQASLRVSQERARAVRYADFAAMDTGDIAAMLDVVVSGALTFEEFGVERGFKLEADQKSVEKLIQRASQRARLTASVEEWLRDMLKYGDTFVEPLFVRQDLVGTQTYRPEEMYRTQDDKGKLATGVDDEGFPAAFQQRRGGKVVAGWKPYELIHGRLFPISRLMYSERGLLDPIRDTWRKLELVEQGMVIARITRAYPRRKHYLDMTGKDPLAQEKSMLAYINRMTRKAFGKRPMTVNNLPVVDVSEDMYISTGFMQGADNKAYPKLNKIETEDPAMSGLSELGDVHYLRGKLWSFVPSDTVGIERVTNTDDDSQNAAYARMLRRCQGQLEIIIRGILDQVLLANGYLPSTTQYRVIFPTIQTGANWKNASARFQETMSVRNLLEMSVISRRTSLKRLYNYSDKEVDAEFEQMAVEAENPLFSAVDTGAGATDVGNKAAADITASNKATKAAKGSKAAVTKTNVNRGTKLGQALRGNLSGGVKGKLT